MAYTLRSSFKVKGTMGLDAAPGVVRIVGIMDITAVPEHNVEPFLQGLDEDEVFYFNEQDWYAFRYEDDALHADWGMMYLPNDSLHEIERAAN